MQDVEVEVISSHIVVFITCHDDGTNGDRNPLKPMMHYYDNLEGVCGTIPGLISITPEICY
jgi:hypothetical protein